MPLIRSASPKAIGPNIKREEAAGKPYRQALAIALSTQERAHHASGGPVRLAGGGDSDSGWPKDVPQTTYIPSLFMDPKEWENRRSLYPHMETRGDSQRRQKLGPGDPAPMFEGHELMSKAEWNSVIESNAVDLDKAGAYPVGSGDPFRRGGHARLASGGFSAPSPSFFERNEARELQNDDTFHAAGLFPGSGAGRTDRLPRAVAADSFVVPADVVSGLGEGSTLAGAKIMDAILASGAPYGASRPHPPALHYASGGQAKDGLSHVMVASGEYLIHRDQLAGIGHRLRRHGKSKARTDLAAGHEWAREFVDNVRGHVKKFLSSAPKPKK